MRKLLLLAVATALVAAAIPAAGAMGATTVKSYLYDNYFTKANSTTKKCSSDSTCIKIVEQDKISWSWKGNLVHNVIAIKAPSGIDKDNYSSEEEGQTEGSFSRRLKKAGSWIFQCTFHPEMTQRVKVSEED